MYDVIIIGGGPAGLTAGITARRHYPKKMPALKADKNVYLYFTAL